MTTNTVQQGDKIVDFRGETWEFIYVSKLPGGGSSGKIVVTSKRLTGSTREFYPSVFDLYITKKGAVKPIDNPDSPTV